MKLSKETLTGLQNFADINKSIYIQKGNVITTKDGSDTIFAMMPVSEPIDIDMPIYALTDFLSIMSLFGDSVEITIDPDVENSIKITDTVSSTTFNICDKSLIDYSDVVLDENILPKPDVVINMSEDTFIKIKKAATTLKLPFLCFYPKNGKVWAKVYNPKEKNGNDYCLEVDDYNDGNEFNFVMKMDYFKMIRGAYEVALSKENYIAFNSPQIKYVITLEKDFTIFK